MELKRKPLLGITMGDPTGAGPEIVVKALCSPEIKGLCRAVVIGDAAAMRAAVEIVRIPAEPIEVSKLYQGSSPETIVPKLTDPWNNNHRHLISAWHQSEYCH